ncbi:hypothetical protein RQP46_008195 [Phenoliferia psychrophenolica]
MAGIPDATLLIQDLLSPASTALAAATPALISYHLSTLALAPPTLLTAVVETLTTSPSLWRGNATRSSLDGGWPTLNWARAKEVFDAVRNGVVYRAGELTKQHGTGWTARRRFSTFFDAYFAGVNADPDAHPAVRLLLASAALAALQIIKGRKDKLYVGGSSLIGRNEKEVLEAWDAYFGAAPETGVGEWSGPGRGEFELHQADGDEVLPAWLAAQTLPMMSVDSLKAGPLPGLLSILSYAFSSSFSHGNLFASLTSDLSPTPTGLHWNVPSPSHTTLTHLLASPLFTSLGPLSRSVGRCLEAAGSLATPASIAALRSTADGAERVANRIHREWASCAWSDASSDEAFDEETREHKEPWTALKSLLFSLTLVESSLLVVLAPQPATPLKRELARQALRTLGLTYFVTMKFGVEGFGAWRGVWSGLVEIVRGDEESCEQLMRELQPPAVGKLHEREVERSVATFYLNAAEQLMKPLPNAHVEDPVLRCCRPYLENTLHRETFESAHSVLLAIFATEKGCASALAPWYTALLLRAYPTLMTTSQLRLAFTTMVGCLSNSDDALAWYCVQELISTIANLPPSPTSNTALLESTPPSRSLSPVTDLTSTDASPEPPTSRDFSDAPPTRLDEASTLSPLETLALQLPRGHLLLTLIDQTTAVNLVLLRSLLDRIWDFVREEEEGEAKDALVKVFFGTLGEGLDATKREEGVRYWMERGEELDGATSAAL